MNGKQLKNSILQWAIQGKLVEQNPKDEPASKLLDRIAAQKAVVNGAKKSSSVIPASEPGPRSSSKKAKSSKVPISRIYRENGSWFEQVGSAEPKDITEEIPFDIPESWEWCSLESVCADIADIDHKMPSVCENGIPYVSPLNFRPNNVIDFDSAKKISRTDFEQLSKKCKPERGDIIFPRYGTIGVIRTVETDIDFLVSYSCATIKPLHDFVLKEYVGCVLQSSLIQLHEIPRYINKTTQPNVGLQSIKRFLFPLAPLAEQKRIVKKLEQILPLVDEYDQAQTQLDKLNKELPESLKKSILQQAIQGKLVPQNPNDEPAQALLDRISAERANASGAKQSKKSSAKVQNSRIYRDTDGLWYEQIGTSAPKDITEEIPFDIPENWTWCRLKNVVSNRGQKTPTEKFSYIDIGSIDNKLQRLNDKENLIEASAAPSRARKIVGLNDILYSTVRPYLHNMCIIDREFSAEPIASTGFAVMTCGEMLEFKYLFYYLLSPDFDSYANDGDNAKGVAYPAINDEKLYKALIPLPPLAEQKRIVAKLEELFEVL